VTAGFLYLDTMEKLHKTEKLKQEILLDCDQSNVLLARIIFFCILLNVFSFLSVFITNLLKTKKIVFCRPSARSFLPSCLTGIELCGVC